MQKRQKQHLTHFDSLQPLTISGIVLKCLGIEFIAEQVFSQPRRTRKERANTMASLASLGCPVTQLRQHQVE